jgi:hypothetical protein
MNVEKYNKPMAAVLGMNKTDFHVINLQSAIYRLKDRGLVPDRAKLFFL